MEASENFLNNGNLHSQSEETKLYFLNSFERKSLIELSKNS
jgi:hypothetical protein